MAQQGQLGLVPERKVWTVSELTAQVRDLLERAFRDLWVQGEVSNFRLSPYGHYYFTLKDELAQLRCFVHKKDARFLRLEPQDGLAVTVRGSLSVYEQRGNCQLLVSYLEPVGVGALQLAFEQLKARLAAEGLFALERKKPLPMLPQRIGLVTSPRGAAIADMIRVLERRYENLHLLLYPVRVQGEGAGEEIVEALGYFNRAQAADVILLARGGGSLEDLWAYNEESVARAIAASKIPVITGIGHETDFTIADFVADLRAPTPSAAAELVVRSKEELKEQLRGLETKLGQLLRYRVLDARHRLGELRAAVGWRRLQALLREQAQRADELSGRLLQALRDHALESRQRLALAQQRLRSLDLRGLLERHRLRLAQQRHELGARLRLVTLAQRKRLETLSAALVQLSPLNVLERGYAIVFDREGKVVKSAAAVRVGDPVTVRLHHGRLEADVKKKEVE
ncbi:MAG: exodeoxyribonuclease VII large subunit [Acidobacteria bacterium]|nr:exodeoxyribonuclease VII large subunit [Acidobacteriota bacterium]